MITGWAPVLASDPWLCCLGPNDLNDSDPISYSVAKLWAPPKSSGLAHQDAYFRRLHLGLGFHLSLWLRNKRPRWRGHWTSPASNAAPSLWPLPGWPPIGFHPWPPQPSGWWPPMVTLSQSMLTTRLHCFKSFPPKVTALSLAHGTPPVKGLESFPHQLPP